jgi:hypothetical protein
MPKKTIDDGEYPPEARFGWDMIEMSVAELNEMCDFVDVGLFDEAEAVVNRAEARLFKEA